MNDNAVIISLNDACVVTSLSRASINRLRVAGSFPREVILGERRIGFVRTEVLTWIDDRVNERVAA